MADLDAYNDTDLLGAELHGYATGAHLRLSVTSSFQNKVWFSNEETTTMLMNPQIWRNPVGVVLDDQGFTQDCYGLVIDEEELGQMADWAGLMTVIEDKWPYYNGVLVHDPMHEDKFVGIKKNHAAHRRRDSSEIVCMRYEVKGTYRCRRRTVLPDNFEAIAGYPAPFPGVMVLQYQLAPSAPRAVCVAVAQVVAANVAFRRNQLGELFVPLYGGPARPPGMLLPF
uniref:Uncharacterized protein n=1 Tax=Hordeum vulgare subsp. vulgare TaxID=112509 RepID=A0A8I6XIM4_HORVV